MTPDDPPLDRRLWRGRTAPEDRADGEDGAFLSPLFTRWRKVEYGVEAMIWLGAFANFWFWWLQPEHFLGPLRFACATLPFAWTSLVTLHFLYLTFGSRVPAVDMRPPEPSRVAMVVTKTPSEPFSVVAETLEAMLRQTWPHDTWLADEDPTAETLDWCAKRGVKVSTRRGHPEYQRPDWPRRARYKEGNLAFFYDHYGYRLYDFVVQMDVDHVPTPTHLSEILKPFADLRVGYVSAPSICDKNADRSWSARARLHAEATVHGLLQAGQTSGGATFCIGSTYAVRTAALESIGGIGPERCEDFSTTSMMIAHGWRGVHAFDAIAHGEGPATFADFTRQEFAWSRSMVTLLLQVSPALLPHVPANRKARLLFWQLWYPLDSISWALLFAMPIVALLHGTNFVDVTFVDFELRYLPMPAILIAMVYRWRAFGWLRPVNSPVLSWEMILCVIARWPWTLLGCAVALRDWLFKSVVEFQVTPKGGGTSDPVPMRVLAPYIVASLVSGLSALLLNDVGTARGFYVFAIFNAALYALLILVIVVRHSSENGVDLLRSGLRPLLQVAVAVGLLCLPIAASAVRGLEGLEAIAPGFGPISLTR